MAAEYQVAQTQPRRRNPVVRWVERFLAIVVIVVVLLAIFLAVSLRHNASGQTTFFGRPVFSVSSGSMAPAFNTGDVILDQPITTAAAEHLHKGQIITFNTAATAGGTSLVITHRIYAVVKGPVVNGTATIAYRTKGDANSGPDQGLVQPAAILGIYQQRIPAGGYVLNALHQPITFVVLIMIPVVYLVAEEVRRRWIRLGAQEAQRAASSSNSRGNPW